MGRHKRRKGGAPVVLRETSNLVGKCAKIRRAINVYLWRSYLRRLCLLTRAIKSN